MSVSDNTIQAIQLHISLDGLHGAKSPNKNWPNVLADFYNNLSKKEKEKIMSTKLVKKETAEKVVEKKVAKKVAKKISKRVSKSGNYKNIRHLMETLFRKNAEITKESALVVIKEEFPNSSFVENPTGHFAWYKTHIVNKNEWVYLDKPKVKMAKIKTAKQLTA